MNEDPTTGPLPTKQQLDELSGLVNQRFDQLTARMEQRFDALHAEMRSLREDYRNLTRFALKTDERADHLEERVEKVEKR